MALSLVVFLVARDFGHHEKGMNARKRLIFIFHRCSLVEGFFAEGIDPWR